MARPTDYSEELVRKLEDAFRDGASITEACTLAGISRDTYYSWLKDKDGFLTKMDDAQEWISEIARSVVAQRITNKKDVETAKWWLERRVKDKFSPSSKIDHTSGGKPIPLLGGVSNVSDNNSNTETS